MLTFKERFDEKISSDGNTSSNKHDDEQLAAEISRLRVDFEQGVVGNLENVICITISIYLAPEYDDSHA